MTNRHPVKGLKVGKNTLVKHPRTITEARAQEIICVLLTHYGPTEQHKLLNLSLLMANDANRKCVAGIEVKRVGGTTGLSQFGWHHLVVVMLIDGVIERVGNSSTFKVVDSCAIDDDDAERIREIEMIPPKFALGLGLRSGD